MTPKEYLQRAFGAQAYLESCREALEHIERNRGIHAIPMGDRVSGGRTDSRIENEALKEVMAEEKLKKAIAHWQRLIDETEAAIEQVRYPKFQMVLRYRYIMCLPWPVIAEKMGVDERSALRIHGKALSCVRVPSGEQ